MWRFGDVVHYSFMFVGFSVIEVLLFNRKKQKKQQKKNITVAQSDPCRIAKCNNIIPVCSSRLCVVREVNTMYMSSMRWFVGCFLQRELQGSGSQLTRHVHRTLHGLLVLYWSLYNE